MRTFVRPLLVYAAATVVFTWPLILHPSSLLGAPVGQGDPFLYVWVLGWDMHAVLSDPMSLLTGAVFDANIFHPAAGTLAYTDHLLLQAVALAPLYALTGDVSLCYNVLLFGSLVASALAMHVFVSSSVGSSGGAYVAGLAWGFGSYRFAHLLHIQLQALYFMPLTFLFLHRLVAGARRRDAVLLGLTAGLQAVSSVYYAVIGGFGLGLAAVALTATSGRRLDGVLVRRLLLAGVVAGILVLPSLLVYSWVQRDQGFGRSLYEASRGAAYASSYLQASAGNVIYGRTGLLRHSDDAPSQGPPRTGPERELFPGFMVALLAVAGVWFARRADARPLLISMCVLALIGFVLSLGPDGVRSVYATLHAYVFGFQAIRAPARFSVLVFFSLATLAAVGWRELRARTERAGAGVWQAAPAVVLAIVALETLTVPVTLAAAPPRQTAVGTWLRDRGEPGAVAVLPLTLDVENTTAMVQSLEHRRPLLNGYSGQRPAFYVPLVDALSTFPSNEGLLALIESDVRFLVAPGPVALTSEDAASVLVERVRFTDATIYELRSSPDVLARLRRSQDAAPPAPGPVPFRAGESVEYSVGWAGAGLHLTAGRIGMRVAQPPYRFTVSADTEPWVERFFAAHDVFATSTDATLMPQTHERRVREGSRAFERVYVFDSAGSVVRIGQSVEHARGEDGVVLPLAAHARDAIATLFYVRTLPLSAGSRYRLPVNEGGRNLIVELTVVGTETIQVQGQSRQAIRVEPRIHQTVARRRPIASTLWLSADAQRVPLALDVDAGFGRFRLELTRYEPGSP